MRKGGALAIEEYLEKYNATSSKKKIPVIKSLVEDLEEAINTGDAIETFFLKGTIPDLKNMRINDDMVDCLMNSFSGPGFLRVIDLSYNDIGDKGATTIAKFVKVL